MDTLTQFNLAMQYIETQLADEIDFNRVARAAGCSEYHFRRMFAFLAGMSLSEYIRCRRLSQAALELLQTEARVIDIAVKYGYGSADAFTRAFYAWHGSTPSEVRRSGTSMKVIPPVTFQLTVRGGTAMKYRLVEKNAFYIVGLHRQVRLIYRGVNPEIAAMWEELSEADVETLDQLSTGEPGGIVNASLNSSGDYAEGSLLDNYIGVVTTQPPAPDRWSVLPVAAATWGVFTSRGPFPDTLQDTWARIYAEWLPTSGYEIVPGPNLVWTDSEEETDPNFHNEIWIPLVRRAVSG